ncbi:hypothetical protein [Flavobacterium fluviale]|nr:hypothetical protein [Flavobacterium fluviale]
MPNLTFRYIGSQDKFVTSELVVSDVCSKCNNEKLSKLDSYFCSLYDKSFKDFHEEKKQFIFEYNYDLLLRNLLKIIYNSSRTINSEDNYFENFKHFILNGNETWGNVILILDIITPCTTNGIKIYPTSMRCGTVDVGIKNENFIIWAVSVNSYYFYILISKEKKISETLVEELNNVYNRIPGTIIHPYKTQTLISDFSNQNSYDAHVDFVNNTSEAFYKYTKNSK